MEIAAHPHLHPRLHRRGRGRAHAPADRAARQPARDSRPHRAAPRRRQRGDRGVAVHRAAQAPPGGAGAHAPAAAHAGPHEVRPGLGRGPGAPTCSPTAEGTPEVILMATGSEVSLCVEAYEKLKAEGVKARVVSMPSWELFEQQDEAYRETGAAPGGEGARGGGAGRGLRLGALGGARRQGDWHAQLRRLGAHQGAASRSSASPPTRWPRPLARSSRQTRRRKGLSARALLRARGGGPGSRWESHGIHADSHQLPRAPQGELEPLGSVCPHGTERRGQDDLAVRHGSFSATPWNGASSPRFSSLGAPRDSCISIRFWDLKALSTSTSRRETPRGLSASQLTSPA